MLKKKTNLEEKIMDTLIEEIRCLRNEVKHLTELVESQQNRKKYHSEYYEKRKLKITKECKKSNRIPNPKCGMFPMIRKYDAPFKMWANKIHEFACRGLSPYNFLTWLSWAWNQNTYEHVPLTKSGGYLHLYIGMSAQKDGRPLRHRYSQRDFTGRMRVNVLTTSRQLDIFSGALWWSWSFHVLNATLDEVKREQWYKDLGPYWHKPLAILQGQHGHYEVLPGIIFQPTTEENLEIASKCYGIVRPILEMGWSASLKGMFSKEEPFKK